MEEKNETKKDIGLSRSKRILRETLSWAGTIIVLVLIAVFMNRFVIFKVQVPSGSMMNTILENDRLIGLRLFSDIKRGDIVTFYNQNPNPYDSNDPKYLVKRVIGLPGETIEIKNGIVLIDGKILNEDYLKESMDPERHIEPLTVPEGCYFVMGDNRNNSNDSRYWEKKFVPKSEINSKIFMKYYPLWKFYKKPEY